MATKLKNLKIKKVDFVDEGANPDAHIRMVKRKEGVGQENHDTSGKPSVWKRLVSLFEKSSGIDQTELENVVEEIEKSGALTFGEQMNERKTRKIADEMWDICFALENSLVSIMRDEELDSSAAQTAMEESLEEFNEVVNDAIAQWSSGKAVNIVKRDEEMTEADVSLMKSAVERLNDSINKACEGSGKPKKTEKSDEGDQKNKEELEGEDEMKIDKSKMTPAERAFFEEIEKRYGTEEAAAVPEPPVAATPSVAKAAETVTTIGAVETPADQGDIYKGLNPLVKAELEALKKFREEAENRELETIAGKYEIIGKKKEELIPVFKSLKAAGGTAYNDMIAVLDQTVEAVNKSGVFSEIGKSGHGSSRVSDSENKIASIAKGYMEKEPSMSYVDAVAKAWENNPELMDAYDEEEGF